MRDKSSSARGGKWCGFVNRKEGSLKRMEAVMRALAREAMTLPDCLGRWAPLSCLAAGKSTSARWHGDRRDCTSSTPAFLDRMSQGFQKSVVDLERKDYERFVKWTTEDS
jgi:hypothetical protein